MGFGGVERDSGRCFLVAVHDRSEKTLIEVIENWIHPKITIISDCWKAYSNLSKCGYQHLTVNHSIEFVNTETGAHTNTIESTWRRVKASLPAYKEFVKYLAQYMFRKRIKSEGQDITKKFLEIVGEIDWSKK